MWDMSIRTCMASNDLRFSGDFLGAATGSPYIVFISTSGMLRSSDRYMYIFIYGYIYIICIHTQVLQCLIYTEIHIVLR